jgi:hypothetical protein
MRRKDLFTMPSALYETLSEITESFMVVELLKLLAPWL